MKKQTTTTKNLQQQQMVDLNLTVSVITKLNNKKEDVVKLDLKFDIQYMLIKETFFKYKDITWTQ